MRKIVFASLALLVCPLVWADNHDDIMAFIERYAGLEGDLAAQSELIRSDRVHIAPTRWTDNAAYMKWQSRGRSHREALNDGASADWLVQIESPIVRTYGDTAVASFIRRDMILPPNAAPIANPPLYQTIVLVRQDGEWGIAHTHVSPVGGAN